MKILLVEDDVEISTMLKNFLSTENYEVVTASDGCPMRSGMEATGNISAFFCVRRKTAYS